MAYLPIKSPPEFNSDIRKIQADDWGEPDTFNPQFEALTNNTVYLKDKLDQQTADFTATLAAAWSGSTPPYTQTVAIPGILATGTPFIDVVLASDPATAQTQEKAWGCVSRITTANGSISAYCNKKKPITAIPLQIKVVR